VAVAVSASFWAARTHAQDAASAAHDPVRVLLVVDQADDPFAKRLQAELPTVGLSVVTVEPWRTGEPVETLEGAARAQGAIAAIRTVTSRKGVEIWMADQVTGRPLLRQLVVDESPEGPNESLIALQTVELLRTSLLSRPAPPPPRPPPPVVVVAPPPPPPPPPSVAETGVTAGLGGLYSPGGAGTALQVWLSLHRTLGRLTRRAEVDIDLSAPARSAALSGPEGSTTVQTYLAGVALLGRMEIPSARLVLDGGAGVGAVLIALQGTTAAPLAAHTQAVLAGAGYLRADAVLEATRWLRIGARAVGGFASRKATVDFAGYEVGGWGRAFAAGLGIIEVAWR
jgi:hypothetical protein